MKIIIYGLIHPETKEIKYIGRTKQNLKYRLSQHICESYSNHGSYKKHWIRKLKNKGLKPQIIIIKELECTWEESYNIEQIIIQDYFLKGCKLTNLEDKGSGSSIRCIMKNGQKSVLQYTLEGNFIKEHISLKEAADFVNGRLKGIHKGLNYCNTAYGFQWKYKSINYPLNIAGIKHKQMNKTWIKVIQLSKENEIIKVWNSIIEAENAIGCNNICLTCKGVQKTSGGFKWKYYEEIN